MSSLRVPTRPCRVCYLILSLILYFITMKKKILFRKNISDNCCNNNCLGFTSGNCNPIPSLLLDNISFLRSSLQQNRFPVHPKCQIRYFKVPKWHFEWSLCRKRKYGILYNKLCDDLNSLS